RWRGGRTPGPRRSHVVAAIDFVRSAGGPRRGSGHRQKIEAPKILKYLARDILDVGGTGLRCAIGRHQRGDLANSAASIEQPNERELDCAQPPHRVWHNDNVAFHMKKRAHGRNVAKSYR